VGLIDGVPDHITPNRRMWWQQRKSLEKDGVSLPAREGTHQANADRTRLRWRQPTQAVKIDLRPIRRKASGVDRVVENSNLRPVPKHRLRVARNAHRIRDRHPTLRCTLIEQARCNRPRAHVVVKMPNNSSWAGAPCSENVHLETIRMHNVGVEVRDNPT